ncbi:MAG: hypothetical protein COT28_03610 [Methylobacterium sp. CG08_land_8_20_14_0_20_71_15]|nr:MAG: hypothetical protein COT56_02360 [Methylobacterium sp. CG09_land_8_20_14_0_10_71_15]PIU15731.1 MAG: hypothetical protein COT28_03610 [Methylobacterium sp. CG08_land_8_20_14_0_20_71_15]
MEGRFRTLILDPPWEDESVSEAQRPPYATMPLEEIRALPVPAWADDPCHLYLWIPNNFLGVGFDLIRGWDFEYKTALTWEKPEFTGGRYFRTNTEHILFAVRGGLMTRSLSIGTRFPGPMGELHSEKPDSFYRIVEAASYPPFGEAFQRRARPGFTNLYAPIGALEAAE